MGECEKKEQNDYEEPDKNTGIGKTENLKKRLILFIKKPWVITTLAMLLALIIGLSVALHKEPIKETNAYLGDICQVSFGEIVVFSANETDHYVTQDDAFVYAPNGKKVISVYGEIRNTTGQQQNIYSDSFRLNTYENKEQHSKSHAFTGGSGVFWNDITLQKGYCQFYMYYLVDETINIEDCRLIVYSAVVALVEKPLTE